MIFNTINNEQLISIIRKCELTIVCYHQKACGPCKLARTVMNKFDEKFNDIILVMHDLTNDDISKEHIKTTPTFIKFKDGKEVNRIEGLKAGRSIIKTFELENI